MTTEKFFFFGSMFEGMVHYNKIKNFIVSQNMAEIQAQAYRLKVGFPVLKNNPTHKIGGIVLELNPNELLFKLIDTFMGVNTLNLEAGLHIKEKTKVLVEGVETECWCYFVNPKKIPKDSILIDDGDWMHSLKMQPPLTDSLTEKQVNYIKKLGSASGRDIVPINDLNLYRELMKLELIVDKGRRLALSKLGQEVYRHIS